MITTRDGQSRAAGQRVQLVERPDDQHVGGAQQGRRRATRMARMQAARSFDVVDEAVADLTASAGSVSTARSAASKDRVRLDGRARARTA